MQQISYKTQNVQPSRLCAKLRNQLGGQKLTAFTIQNGQEGPSLLFRELEKNAAYELVAIFPNLNRILSGKLPQTPVLEKQNKRRVGTALYKWMVCNGFDLTIPEQFEGITASVESHASAVAYSIVSAKQDAPNTLKMPASF